MIITSLKMFGKIPGFNIFLVNKLIFMQLILTHYMVVVVLFQNALSIPGVILFFI